LGIQLDGTEKSNDAELPGAGYAWVDPVELTIINLNPHHYVTNNNLNWDNLILYQSSDAPGIEKEYPSIVFHDSEVYLNHKFTDGREKTVLMGLKFFDTRNNQLFMQDRAAWYKKAGKGEIFYFMPGHSSLEFQNSNYSQMILNAIHFK
jgi:type 1 glutamine amidotransferase